MKSFKLTIYEIARQAKVSIATVSRFINPETRAKVAAETCERLEKIIKQTGYTPSLAAKHLSRASYKTIGIVFPHHRGMLASDYYTQILTGVSDALLETDYRMKMILLKPERGPWDHYDFRHGEAVDGLILTYWRSVFSNAKPLSQAGLPCVIINNVEKKVKARFVAGDHYEGGRMAAEHLAEYGHRNIIVFSGNEGAPDVAARLEGFKAGLAKYGISLKPRDIYDVDFREDLAYEKTGEVVAKRSGVTAIFCANDAQAFGVLRRLKELKIPCPGKISVAGYDDDRESVHTDPPLTTVRVPVYELGRQAALDLIARIQGESKAEFFKPVIFPVRLIERASVAKKK